MDLTTFTDADLHDLSAQIAAEWERRRASAVTDQAITEVVTGLQDAGKLPAPAAGEDADTDVPWQDPGTDHSAMYHQGDHVTHNGRVWLSKHPGLNHWEPGAPGVDGRIWLDVTPAPTDPDPTDPESGEPEIIAWGVGQEVEVGDLRTHDDYTWECILAHTTHEGWAPGPDTHAVWKFAG